MCLCHILDIQVQRSPLVRPWSSDNKARKGTPSCRCVQMHLYQWDNPENPVICQYTWKPAVSSFKQQYVRRLEGSGNLSLLLALQEHCASICQPLGAVGPEQPVSSWEMFLKVFQFKDYTCRIRFSEKGFSRLHFVVVLSKFLVITSKDHSLLYWKL